MVLQSPVYEDPQGLVRFVLRLTRFIGFFGVGFVITRRVHVHKWGSFKGTIRVPLRDL